MVAADHVQLAFASPKGPATLKLGRAQDETIVSLVQPNTEAAAKANFLPIAGQARLIFGYLAPDTASLTINDQTIKIAGGVNHPQTLDLPHPATVGTVAFLAAHVMLLTLVARRFARRQQNPPPTFANIGLGLLAGAAGALLTSGVTLELVPASWDLLGKRLLTEGMVMLLVLGVGGFLGPRLLARAAPEPFNALTSCASIGRMSFIAGLARFWCPGSRSKFMIYTGLLTSALQSSE